MFNNHTTTKKEQRSIFRQTILLFRILQAIITIHLPGKLFVDVRCPVCVVVYLRLPTPYRVTGVWRHCIHFYEFYSAFQLDLSSL